VNEVIARPENPRIARLIEIQATRVIAGPNSESREADALGVESGLSDYVERLSAFSRVRIVIERQQRLSQEWKPSAPRFLV
jgi:hypothetical protein